jgi:3-isopropylmalate/(R)-2-methylmalate dehydratase small subunit
MTARELVRTGRVWKFGDNINTDLMLPHTAFRMPKAEQHTLCFEAIRPGWVKEVKPGDLIVAGENFGMGSGRPVGTILVACGIAGVVAEAINGLCLRNCVNFSLPAIDCPGVTAIFEDGDTARIDYLSGRVENLTNGKSLQGKPLASLLADIVLAGGVVPMLVREGYVEETAFIASSH